MKLAIATVLRTSDYTKRWERSLRDSVNFLIDCHLTEEVKTFRLWDKPIPEARQEITERILAEGKYTHMLFIDSDTFITGEQLIHLVNEVIEKDYDVLCYPVYLKSMPLITNIYTDMLFRPLAKMPGKKVFEIELTGLAACLINLKVFSKIDKPWFKGKWKVRQKGRDFHFSMGEDTAFFYKLKRAGIKIYCDPRHICSHYNMKEDLYYPELSSTRNRANIIINKKRCYNGN
jgi:GT2 family glycosyltransferase